MIIQANENQVEQILPMARQFSAQSEFGEFNEEVVIENTKQIIRFGIGELFLYMKEGRPIGALLGFKHPNFFTGELMATEAYWYVDEKHRGVGLRLLSAFEKWAEAQGCKKIIMMHIADVMPDAVRRIYERRRYKYLETHYIKEI